jgi:hypothetical protein
MRNDAEEMQSVDVLRIRCEDLAVTRSCFGKPPRAVMLECAVKSLGKGVCDERAGRRVPNGRASNVLLGSKKPTKHDELTWPSRKMMSSEFPCRALQTMWTHGPGEI